MLALLLLLGVAAAATSKPAPPASSGKNLDDEEGWNTECDKWIYHIQLAPEHEWLQTEARLVTESPYSTPADWARIAALWQSYGYYEAAACFQAVALGDL